VKLQSMLVALTLLVPTGAGAQDLDNRGTESDQEACTPDVFRLCQDFIPDETRIVACLENHKTALSPACSKVMFPPTGSIPKHRHHGAQ
jgi:hypothetical protein